MRVSNDWNNANSDTATVTVAFTDNTLIAGSTAVKRQHVTELRTRIDALRARFGLSRFAWTDGSLVNGVTVIKAVHIVELRQALSDAYSAAALTPPAYTDPTLAGMIVKKIDVEELRNAVHALEGS